jgi:hypothetical protein
MPAPLGTVEDLNEFPLATQVQLLADVPLTGINTQVDILTFGTLQPGMYMLSAYVTIAQITANAVVTLKFLSGATVIAGTEVTVVIGAGSIAIPAFPFGLGVAAIVKLVGFSTALTSTAKSVCLNNAAGTQNFSTNISALRIA